MQSPITRALAALGSLFAVLALAFTLATGPAHAAPPIGGDGGGGDEEHVATPVVADLSASASDHFGCGKWMHTTAAYYHTQRLLIGTAKLTNDCQLAGFHSSFVALLEDTQGNVVGYTMPRRYGIDGKGLCTWFGCPPTRVLGPLGWQDTVNPPVRPAKLTIVQYPSPNTLLESMQQLRIYLDEAVRLGKTVADAVTVVKQIAA